MLTYWNTLVSYLKCHIKSERGQGMVEYGLILALVSVVVIGALSLMGGNLNAMFGNAANSLNSQSSGAQ